MTVADLLETTASVLAGVATVAWFVVLLMGGLQIFQTVKGHDNEGGPGSVAMIALVPAVTASVAAVATYRAGASKRRRR